MVLDLGAHASFTPPPSPPPVSNSYCGSDGASALLRRVCIVHVVLRQQGCCRHAQPHGARTRHPLVQPEPWFVDGDGGWSPVEHMYLCSYLHHHQARLRRPCF